MQVKQLYYILKVAETGSYYQAADSLFINHQTLRNSIKTLEKELGIQFFVSTNNGTELTSNGKLYLNHCKQMIQLYEEMRNHVLIDNAVKKEFNLNIGLNFYAKNLFYNDLSSDFNDAFPNISFFPTITNDPIALLHSLLNWELDMVICANQPLLFADDQEISFNLNKTIEFKPLFHDKLVFKVAQGHPLLNVANISILDILKYPIVDFLAKYNITFLRNLTKSYNLTPPKVKSIVLDEKEPLKDFLYNQDAIVIGYANTPLYMYYYSNELSTVPFEDKNLEFDFGVFHLKDTENLWAIEQYISYIKNIADKKDYGKPF